MLAATALLLAALATAPTTAPATTTPAPAAAAATTRPAQAMTTTTAAPATAPATATAATAPATTTATTALDQSSPKALLKTFFASHGEIDQSVLRSLLHASNPVEQKLLDSAVQIELANGRLRAAEREKFGKASTAPSSPVSGPIPREAAGEIDSFIEKIDGDHATVCPPKAPTLTIELVRVDGKWKLPIASLLGKIDPAAAYTLDASTHVRVTIIDALTAEVKAGKLTSEEQVRQELDKRLADRLAAATRGSAPPPPAPATAPVSQPARGT
jgi:hypothetical protein